MNSEEIKGKRYEFMLKAIKQLYAIYDGKNLTSDESKELQLALYMVIFNRHLDNKSPWEPFENMGASIKKGIVDNCLSRIKIITKKGKVVNLNNAKDKEIDFDNVASTLENTPNIDMEELYDFKSQSKTISELKENYTKQVFRYTRNCIAHGRFYIDYENDKKIHFLKKDGSESKTVYEFSCLFDTCDKMQNALVTQKGIKKLPEYYKLLDCLKNDKPIDKNFFENDRGKNLYFNLFTKLAFAYNGFRDSDEYKKFRSKFDLEKPMRTLKLPNEKNKSEVENEYDKVNHMRNSATHFFHKSKKGRIRVIDKIKEKKTADFNVAFNSIVELSRCVAMVDPMSLQNSKPTSIEERN